MIRKLLSCLSGHKEIRQNVDKEFAVIENLSVCDAYNSAVSKIREHQDLLEIIKNYSNDYGRLLDSFEPYTKKFFEEFEEIYLPDGDSRIRVFGQIQKDAQSMVLVCQCKQDDADLLLVDGGALVQSFRNGKKLEDFKSIFHYILMTI